MKWCKIELEQNRDKMPYISADEALEAVAKYLADSIRRKLKVTEAPKDAYMAGDVEEFYQGCWHIHVPSEEQRIGASRIVSISKKTGKIVGDSYYGE